MGRIRLSPALREELIEQQKSDLPKLINRDFGLLLRNAQLIVNHEPYFYCLIPGAYLSAMFIPESGPIPLGVLIKLWEQREWIDRCSQCRGWVYIIGASHNPLSEACTWWGFCTACKGDSENNGMAILRHGTRSDFDDEIYQPARSILRQYDNMPLVPVQSVSFVELIQIMKSDKSGAG